MIDDEDLASIPMPEGRPVVGCFQMTRSYHIDSIPTGATCDHSDMAECCDGCGHFSCSCGIEWDDGAFGHFDDEWDPNDPELWGEP